MPNDNYLIQSPKGETISLALQKKISDTAKKLGIPTSDWRYVVLQGQNFKDAANSYGQSMPHHTDTAFSNLPGKVTYLNQDKLNTDNSDAFVTTLAHEYGHRKYGTSEDTADKYAKQSVEQYRKYGRSNDGAAADLKQQSESVQFQPTSAPIETNLIPPSLPSNVQKAVDQVRSQEAAHQAWLQSQSQTPSKYQMGQPQ